MSGIELDICARACACVRRRTFVPRALAPWFDVRIERHALLSPHARLTSLAVCMADSLEAGALGDGSQHTRRSSSSRSAEAQLGKHQERLLLRDRALQLKHLPSLGMSERPRSRVGLDAVLPAPWTPSSRMHEHWLLLMSLLANTGSFVTLFRLAFTPPGLRSVRPLCAGCSRARALRLSSD
jgi:hypothetical protein